MKTGKGVPRKKKKKTLTESTSPPTQHRPRVTYPEEKCPANHDHRSLSLLALHWCSLLPPTLTTSAPQVHPLSYALSPPLPPPYKQLATPTFRPKQAPHGRLNSQPAKFNTPDRRLNVFLSLNEGRYGDKGILFSRRESRGFLSKWSYVTTVRVVP